MSDNGLMMMDSFIHHRLHFGEIHHPSSLIHYF